MRLLQVRERGRVFYKEMVATEINQLAEMAWDAHMAGRVELTQRRMARGYEYIATMRHKQVKRESYE
jgi:hypothetical protein